MWVICLCAEWCDVCCQYRSAFEALAADWPDARFLWIDIEDQEEIIGDLEIETFPTLLIAHGQQIHFFGPLPPHTEVLRRLLQEAQNPEAPVADEAVQALALLQRIQKS